MTKSFKNSQKIFSKNSAAKNLTVIFFLGISSGLPLALVLSTLKAWLLDKGFDLKTIGFFSLVSLPYSLKFLFAPIIDSTKLPILTRLIGQRKSWILLSQILLGIFIFLLGLSGIFNSLAMIAVFAVLVAFASACQDVVIDGYRIELIEKENQGLAASWGVYGYNIGMLISGAGALALADIFSWDAVYLLMSAIMFSAVLIVFFAKETRQNFQSKNDNFLQWLKSSVLAPLQDFFQRKNWLVIISFVIFFKLGDAFAGSLTLPFLLEIGFSKLTIAGIVKTFGLFATLFGVFVGGFLVKKIGLIKSLWIAAIFQMLSNLAFSYLAVIGPEVEKLYFVVFIENFSGGIGSAVFVAYLSSLCNLMFSATQYALLSSLATFARSLLTSSSGIFAQSLGWYQFFIFSAFAAIPGLIFLFLITQKSAKKSVKKLVN